MVFDVEPMRTSKKKNRLCEYFVVRCGKGQAKKKATPFTAAIIIQTPKKSNMFSLPIFLFAQFQCVFMLFMHVSMLDLDILYFCITLTHTLIRYHARARRIIIRYSHMCKPKGPHMWRNIHESNSIRMCSV